MSKRITTRRAVLAGAGGIAAGALAVLPAQARLLGADRVTLIQKLWAQRVAVVADCERLERESHSAWERRKAATSPVPDDRSERSGRTLISSFASRSPFVFL